MASLDQQLADGVASGRLTDQDAEEVLRFREFLRLTNEIKVECILPDGTVEDVSDHVDPSDPVLWLADVLCWVRMGQHICIDMDPREETP